MKNRKFHFILIAIIIILVIIIGFSSCELKALKQDNFLNIDKNSQNIETPNLNNGIKDTQDYFELMGFGELLIDEENPYLHLINPSNNCVYLEYKVLENENVLYETQLIEPDRMVKYNVYDVLDAGKHKLTYSINVYDIDDKNVLWSDIKQNQEITIYK